MHHKHHHTSTAHKVKTFLIVTFIVLMGCTVAAFAATRINMGKEAGAKTAQEKFALISPQGHETIKASVLSDNPSSYRINVKKMANMNVDQEAPTFAVYIKSSVPSKCGDFRDLELPYKKPTKYEREFNLADHPDVLKALDSYGCVVMRNIPPKG